MFYHDLPKPKSSKIKTVDVHWKDWAKGLNKLVAATKIRKDELSEASNVILVELGSPSRRPGSANYGADTGGSSTTMLAPFYKSDGTSRITKIEDGLFKYANADASSYSTISGASFPSGGITNYAITNDILYMSNGYDPLTKFNGTTLARFATLSTPTGVSVSRGASLVSGTNTYSYRVSAVNNVGETLASSSQTVQTDKQREYWNTDQTSLDDNYTVDVSWTKVTGASGYNVYGVIQGRETYLDHVDGEEVTTYTDYGYKTPSSVFDPPAGNTTDAPKGKYIKEFKSSLLIGGDPDNPSRLYYSAGLDLPDSFLISDGGGFIDISKNSDDGYIKGIGIYQNKAIIFKERSVWQLDFTESIIPSLANIVKGIGCVSHRTIIPVENDLYFLGRKPGGGPAIYVLGNEPNYLNVLRTNELSARIRPVLQTLIASNYESTHAMYIDARYTLFFAEGNSAVNDKAAVYDRERLGFTEWEDLQAGHSMVFYEEDGDEKVLFVDESDNRVSELSSLYGDDKGTPISWMMRTREEDFDSPFLYKKTKWVNMRLRSVSGTVTLKVYRNSTQVAYSTNISIGGTATATAFRGWGFRTGRFRVTKDPGSAVETTINRRLPLQRQGANAIGSSVAFEISGSALSSKATLLDVEFKTRAKSERYRPKSEIIED